VKTKVFKILFYEMLADFRKVVALRKVARLRFVSFQTVNSNFWITRTFLLNY
jgi:hypothetical protein